MEFLSIKRLRYARPRKRLAAPGFARARRAVGGIACKPASALGRASAMRCIAANRHGSPLRGTRNFTERPHVCLRPGLKAPFKPFSVEFGVGRSPLPWSREAPSPRTLCVPFAHFALKTPPPCLRRYLGEREPRSRGAFSFIFSFLSIVLTWCFCHSPVPHHPPHFTPKTSAYSAFPPRPLR